MKNNRKFEFPSLDSERIQLKLLTLADLEEVYHHFSDHEVTRFMDIEPCKTEEEADRTIEQ